MILNHSAEQEELRSAVRSFLAKTCPLTSVRERAEMGAGHDPDAWRRACAELGLAGLAVPEEFGGQGFGLVELAVVMEECGAALADLPLFSSAVRAGLVLAAMGESDLLPRVAQGETLAALVTTGVRGTSAAMTGTSEPVPGAQDAEHFVVVTQDAVVVVPADAPGVRVERLEVLDATRPQARVHFSGVVGREVGAPQSVHDALDRIQVALAAESLGVHRAGLEMTVEYARVREQFGRPIGSFQAVKHGLADMHVDLELSAAVVAHAAWAADHAPTELSAAAATCRALVLPAAFEAANQMVQYHGGIGFTWEHDAHLYFKRAKTNESLGGRGKRRWRSWPATSWRRRHDRDRAAGRPAGGGVRRHRTGAVLRDVAGRPRRGRGAD